MTILQAIPTARFVLGNSSPLPEGVKLRPLTTREDRRGNLTELFREEWGLGQCPVQWNLVRSEANVLRGVHVHRKHIDYLTMPMGEIVLGLHDLRSTSSTHRLSLVFRLQAHDQHLVVIPTGVAHGFYFPEPATLLYAVSHCFDVNDEFGCRWNEAALGLAWPCQAPLLSERDRVAGSYADMISAVGL
jgi:dTDP-4-dehydrorhamnose 3,5-epimerase